MKMGKLCIELNEYENAIISLENALGVLQNTSEKTNIMKSNLLIGKAYLKMYDYEMAEKYLIEADRLSKELKSSIHNRNSNVALSEMYFAQNNIKESSYYNELARKYERDINHIKTQSGIFSAYMEYEKGKSIQEIADIKMSYTMKSKLKNAIIISTVLVITLLVIIFVFANIYWNKRREANESIASSALLKVNLFNNISKELKSPLIIINGLVDRLKHSIDEGNKTSNLINLEIIELQAQNISFLIDETISLSQANYNIKSKWVSGNIVNFLKFLFNSFYDDAKNRGVNMSFIANQPEINMVFCKERLQLAIINILFLTLRNSVKEDKIFLSVNHNDADSICHISIVHKGITSHYEELPNEFKDLATSLNNSEDEPMSRLTLLRKTIEDMGGTFSFHNENENDTSFNISFPIKKNKRLDKYSHNESIEYEPGKEMEHVGDKIIDFSSHSGNKGNKENIMIVDDNKFMSFYISSLISHKYNVVTCQSGVEALREIEKNTPDLIIMDQALPQMSGNQLTEIIKRTPSTSHIPIIMNIVKESNEDRVKSIKAGVDSFLVKPFVEEELHALIEQLLDSRKGLLKKIAQTFIEKGTDKEAVMDDDDITFIKKVSEIIHSDISSFELSTQVIADKMHISTSHLNRRIKTVTGLSTTGDILNIRLGRAKKILIKTQRPIGDVAMECGFADFAYFSRTFKKEFGITPSQYQRMGVE